MLKGVAIRDEAAIRQAVAKLQAKGIKCSLVQDVKPRMYTTGQGPVCEHVLRLEDGRYDVGFQRQEDGTFAPVFDEYQKHVGKQIGADVNVCPMPKSAEGRAQHQIGQFMAEYAEAAATNAAIAQGYFVEGTITDDKGNVHLTIGGM
jgi:hypothetical protein